MPTQIAHIRWRRVLVATVLVYLISFLIIFGIIFVYAFVLGFQARGMPDQAQIQQFANQVAPWGARIGLVALTVVAAAWVVRGIDHSALVQGGVLGLMVGLPNLLMGRPLSLEGLLTAAITVGAGVLGAGLGSKRP